MLTTLQVLPLLLLELLYAAIYVVTWVGASYLLGGATTPILFGLLGFMFFFMLHDYETRTLRSWASSTGSAAYWLTRYALTFYLLPLPGLIL